MTQIQSVSSVVTSVPPRNTLFAANRHIYRLIFSGTDLADKWLDYYYTNKGNMKFKMKRKSFSAILVVLAMFVAAPSAHATTVTEVQAMIGTLKTKTETLTVTGKSAEKDLNGLLSKLSEAALKVDQGKFCDAIVKLNDFKTRVNALIATGRINQDPAAGTTGQDLLNDADATIAALNQLQTQSTGAACTF